MVATTIAPEQNQGTVAPVPVTTPQANPAPTVAAPTPTVAPTAPQAGPNPTPAPITPEIPIRQTDIPSNAQKINGIMLWYAVSAYAYAMAYHKTAADILASANGNGLFPLDNAVVNPRPISTSTMRSEKEQANSVLRTPKQAVRAELADMEPEQAQQTLSQLGLDQNLDSEI